MLYTGRSISCADKTNAQALRSERCPAKSLLLNGGLETSCFQPFSAACFSRSFVSARLKLLPLCKAKSLGCFSGLSSGALWETWTDLRCFFRLCRRRLSGMVGGSEKATQPEQTAFSLLVLQQCYDRGKNQTKSYAKRCGLNGYS